MDKTQLKAAIVGFLISAGTALVSKLVVLALDTQSAEAAINYIAINFGAWIQIVVAGVTGGALAKWRFK